MNDPIPASTILSEAATKKLGDILIECNVVTQKQVEAALVEQKRSGKLFGEALLDLGFVSEEDLGWALSAQLRIPYVDLDRRMVDEDAVHLLGAERMRRHRLVPIMHLDEGLTIAMSDPTNTVAIREIEETTGLNVFVSIASPRQIRIILDEICPEERRAPEPDDLLFREITRPTLSETADSARTNPLGPLFATALRERVREIHLEPLRDKVRVRFRRGAALEEASTIPRVHYDGLIHRLRTNLAPADDGRGIQRWNSTLEFETGSLDLCLTLLPGTEGEALIVEISEVPRQQAALSALGLDPADEETLASLVASRSGLIVIVGLAGAAPARLLGAMAHAVDSETRRVVCLNTSRIRSLPGVLEMKVPAAGDDRAGAERGDLREHLMTATYVDVLILGALATPRDFDQAAAAATAGKLVLASAISSDGLTYLSSVLERGCLRSLTAVGLAAVVEVRELAPGKVGASILSMTPDLASAIRSGETPAALENAARLAGYRPLAERLLAQPRIAVER